MSKLFVLGSGFSRSISLKMPTLKNLSNYLYDYYEDIFSNEFYKRFANDFENLLTYLQQPMPWKTREEILKDRSNFVKVSKLITKYISECEEKTFEKDMPEWAIKFIRYIHNNKFTVATLNYDTIIERLAYLSELKGQDEQKVYLQDIYQLPIANVKSRTSSLWSSSPVDTFRLLKLHGSINWYYTGGENFGGQQIFYVSVKSKSPFEDKTENNVNSNLLGLEPLVIPPVSEKSLFYQTNIVKVLWSEFRKALSSVEEIYFIGYSLPKTDLTIRMFFNAYANSNEKNIYIIDKATGEYAKKLYNNYNKVFSNCTLNDDFVGLENPVKLFMNKLLS
ncbi:SIR2 family protein [Fuchsiella alkaliacetigena]|uniref:SIR2 family protein n=1 Tax=Fuchsiella alkaliacetigena TaxID=957042 RepID=UPI00200B16CF|nr:SIR2 family protein [Fuchsiella alkaliacetigena]MCK8825969.1 SIR2 family protein [Fuchsiella alkaliacetigena]